jgi:hypothetical protein
MLGHSADLLGLFALPNDHPLLASGVEGESPEDYVALGYAALGLALVGGITSWGRREVKFWAVLGVIALVLALGPQLQVGSVVTGVPMPFKLVEGAAGDGSHRQSVAVPGHHTLVHGCSGGLGCGVVDSEAGCALERAIKDGAAICGFAGPAHCRTAVAP